jgi:hypothetical protein
LELESVISVRTVIGKELLRIVSHYQSVFQLLVFTFELAGRSEMSKTGTIV